MGQNVRVRVLTHGSSNRGVYRAVDPREMELRHWKYIDKIKTASGKWRYIYDKAKNKVKGAIDNVKENIEEAKDKAGDFIDDVKDAMDSTKNKYDVTSGNYAEKIKQLAQDPEWQEILKRRDPEYIKIDPDTGNTTYDIDSYLVNKKHPYLDALNDIAAGRKISTLKVDADTTVAAIKDHIRSKISTIKLAVTAVSRFLTERFKYGQGSYDDEIAEASKKVASTINTMEETYRVAPYVAKKYAKNATSNAENIVDAITASADGRELIDAGQDYIKAMLKRNYR